MNKPYKKIAITISAALVLSSISYDVLALRPMASRIRDKKPKAEVIDAAASIKKINEYLWEWNFKIDVLSHKRIYLRGQGKRAGNVLRSLDAVVARMRKHIPSFDGIVSKTAISRLERAIEFLEKKRKGTDIRTPNEPVANRLITSVMLEVMKMREPALRQRLEKELPLARVFYNGKTEKWCVREQRFKYSKRWETSVLSYRYISYDTLWEAFRALDHQIDTELEERSWLIKCQELLDKLREGGVKSRARLRQDIDSMLARLKKVRVEDKRLARIILIGAKELLDFQRTKQSRGYLHIAQDLFVHRMKEAEQIVEKLNQGRLDVLRKEADRKNEYLMEKTAKILRNLKGYHYGLTAKIIDEDLIYGQGRRYLKEPDFAVLAGSIEQLNERLKGKPLNRNEISSLRRFFLLFWEKVVASMATDNFMEDFRDEWVRVLLHPGIAKETRKEIFKRIFARYYAEDPNVKKHRELYYTIFTQAVFVPPKIGRPGEREENPEFLRLSDAITTNQAKRFGIRPQGLKLLLFRQIDLAISQAA